MSSVTQAGPCVRSNQLDYDEDVMHKVRIDAKSTTKLELDEQNRIIVRRDPLALFPSPCAHHVQFKLTLYRRLNIFMTMFVLIRRKGGHLR